VSISFPAALSSTAEITATVRGNGFMDVMTDNNGFMTDVHGNLTSYSGSISNDSFNPAALAPKNSSSGSEGTMASAEGGSVTLGGLFGLLVLVVARRRV